MGGVNGGLIMNKQNLVVELATKTDARLKNLGWSRLTAKKRQEEAAQWIKENENFIRQLVLQYQRCVMVSFDDLMQEARIAAWKAFASYDENRVDVLLSTYLWKVMDNALKEVFRKAFAQKRQNLFNTEYITDVICQADDFETLMSLDDKDYVDDLLVPLFGTSEASDEIIEKRETIKFLTKQINSLPANLQIVVKLHLSGNTQREIAEKLGLSQSSVSLRLKNARLELKRLYNIWNSENAAEGHTLASLESVFRGEYPDEFWESRIKELPVDLGKVVVLRIAGYSVKEMAKALKISESKVWKRLGDAKLELKKFVIERIGA